MERTLILDCVSKVGEAVKICGFVTTRRDHGKIVFLDISDRSGVLQVVANGELAGSLRPQDVVCITGKVSKRPENLVNKNLVTGSIELQAEEIEVLSKAEELPFDMGVKDL
ncbi:MAG: Aspartyl-tRNA synthetase, partial [Candidatus Daviesbacteria bacterium GW2011_GWB1_41_5]